MKQTAIKLLRKSEKYTKTDMVYLVGQSGWLLFGQGAVFLSSFLLAWIFANYINPADYGLYKYVVSIATVASLTSLTGIGVALARTVSQGHEVRLARLARLRILCAVIGSIGLLGTGLYYLSVDNTLLGTLFAVAALWLPFYDTLTDYQFFLQGKQAFRTQTWVRIAQRLILTGLVIAAILISSNIIFITAVFFGATALSHFVVLRYTLSRYPCGDDSATPYTALMNYAKRMSFQNILFIGASQLDKILLFKILGPTQLAMYYFAVAIPQELSGLLGNVNSVVFPKLVDKHSHEFKFALLRKIGLFTVILLIPILGYVLAAPYLFAWFFPVYLDAVFISQLFVGTILFIPMSLIWHHFYATDHKHALWFGTFAGPASLILGIIILAPLYGLVGAVLATYVRGFVDLISGLYFFLHKTNSTPITNPDA